MTDREAMKMSLDALETKGEHHKRVYEAIEALRQALAQPEQEPVKCTCGYAIGHPLVSKCICTLRKPWTGLTVDEILDCYKDNLDRTMFVSIVQAVEAKLKEKNT